jgi:hypothetical protein
MKETSIKASGFLRAALALVSLALPAPAAGALSVIRRQTEGGTP